MITICLDESGSFEGNLKDKKIIIGGAIYTGSDYAEEKKRLERFFIDECQKYNLNYPSQIHTTEMNNKKSYEKDLIIKDLMNYLKSNGRYHITMMIKGDGIRKEYENISNIVDDDKASNLYEHMLCRLINNILFYNPYFEKDTEVNLEIPTRVRVFKKYDDKNMKIYKELGYNFNEKETDILVYLTDQRTFKTAISTKIMESKIKRKVEFKNINVMSTNYKENGETTPYLYLADFICDILRDMIDLNSDDINISECQKTCLNLTNNPPLIWAYDEIDEIWNNLCTSYYEKDFLGCLNNLYDIYNNKSKFSSHYAENWTENINKRIKYIFKKDEIDIYLSSIAHLFSKEKDDCDRGLFMSLKLFDIILDHKEKIDSKYIYRAADLILRGYNHKGNIIKSYEYYNICESLKSNIDVEEYLSTVNRIVEIDANEFKFNDALKKIEEILPCLDIQKYAKQEIAKEMKLDDKISAKYALRGKALSSCGQFYSFLRDKEKAIKYFFDALLEFEIPSADRNVTISYILHLAIDTKDIELYKKYSMEYFSSLSLSEQFGSVINRNFGKQKDYMMYVYIKALDILFLENIETNLLKKIYETDYAALGFNTYKHPWELIYKHIAMILYKKGMENIAENFIKRALNCINDGGITIKLINLYTQINALIYSKESSKNNISSKLKELERLIDEHERIKEYFLGVFEKNDTEKTIANLKNKFTYMYD